MNYRPIISATERNGELALWINMPNGLLYNIWDMPRDDARKYISAIRHAFELGAESMKQQISEIRVPPTISISEELL